MPTQILMDRLRNFRHAEKKMREARDAEFAPGRAVRVISARFNGFGWIVRDSGCPLDQLPVQLENGNVWWYPLEDCTLARRENCPAWLQNLLKKDSVVNIRKLTKHLKAQRI